VKAFVVPELACFDTPPQVVASVKAEFGLEVRTYDPPVKLTPKQANIYCWGFQPEARIRDAVCGRRFGKTFLGKAEMRRAARLAAGGA